MYRIGIDAMGLTKGLGPVIDSILYFLEDYSDVEFVVFGKRKLLNELDGFVKIIDCIEVAEASDNVDEIVKNGDYSITKLLEYAKEKNVDAIVSGANSQIFLNAAAKTLKLYEEIEEPALVNLLPTKEEGDTICVLDCGYSDKKTPERFYTLGQIGRVVAQVEKNMPNPRISILKTRYDNLKLNKEAAKAEKYIKEKELQGFKGTVEARHVFTSEHTDVVVCGAQEGEILVAMTEGASNLFVNSLSRAFNANFTSKLGYAIARSSLEPVRKNADFKNYSGALIMGFDIVAVKAPENSDIVSFYSSIKLAYNMCKKKLINKMQSEFF